MKTKAAVLIKTNCPLEIEELEIPVLKPGQVLVKVAYSGVCKTQYMEIKGLKGEDKFLPHTLGHEGSGTVLEVGEGVKKVKPGDTVVLSWIKGSGLDVPSTTYRGEMGVVNSGAISTLMQYTVICENRLTPIPKEMPLKEASLLGCAISTGAGIVMNNLKLTPGSSIAIFGVGGIGLSALMAAEFMNASTIIAVDIFDHKLAQAKELGANFLINSKNENPIYKINEITQGKGVDYSVESVGYPQTMEMAYEVVKNKTGICVLAGNLPAGEKISINPFHLILGKKLTGTWGGESFTDTDIPIYVDLFFKKKLRIDQFPVTTYPLEKANQVFEDLKEGRVGRGIIGMDF